MDAPHQKVSQVFGTASKPAERHRSRLSNGIDSHDLRHGVGRCQVGHKTHNAQHELAEGHG